MPFAGLAYERLRLCELPAALPFVERGGLHAVGPRRYFPSGFSVRVRVPLIGSRACVHNDADV